MPNGIGSRLAQARLDKLPGRTKEADCVCELIGLRIDLIWVALTVWIVYWNFALSLSLLSLSLSLSRSLARSLSLALSLSLSRALLLLCRIVSLRHVRRTMMFLKGPEFA